MDFGESIILPIRQSHTLANFRGHLCLARFTNKGATGIKFEIDSELGWASGLEMPLSMTGLI